MNVGSTLVKTDGRLFKYPERKSGQLYRLPGEYGQINRDFVPNIAYEEYKTSYGTWPLNHGMLHLHERNQLLTVQMVLHRTVSFRPWSRGCGVDSHSRRHMKIRGEVSVE